MTTQSNLPSHNEPSMSLALWLAFGLGLASLALSTYAMLTNHGADILLLGGLLGIVITAFSSPLIALTSAVMAMRDLKKAPEVMSVHSTVFRALRVFRYLLTLDIALMPAIVISGMYMILDIPILFTSISGCYDEASCTHLSPVVAMPDNVVGQTLGYLFFALGLWGLCLLLPSLSAVLARLTRNAGIGVTGAWIVWGGIAYVIMWLPYTAAQLFSSLTSQAVLAGLPYLITALILLAAQPDAKTTNSSNPTQTA